MQLHLPLSDIEVVWNTHIEFSDKFYRDKSFGTSNDPFQNYLQWYGNLCTSQGLDPFPEWRS